MTNTQPPPQPTPPPLPPIPGSQRIDPRPITPKRNDDLWDTVLNGKNMFRAGLVLVLIGLVFMFRYAIDQGWIGPVARVAAGASASLVMAGVGARLVDVRKGFGTLLVGGGIAGMYLTVFAAFRFYAMTTNTMAFVQLVVVALVGVGLAIHWDSEPLAIAGLAGALIAPLIVPGNLTADLGDAPYTAMVLAAVVAVFLVRDWLALFGVTFGMTLLIALSDAINVRQWGTGEAALGLTLSAMFLAFAVAPAVGHALGRLANTITGAASFVVGPTVLGIARVAFDDVEQLGIAGLILATVHGLFSYQFHEEELPMALHALSAAGLAAVSTALLFEGPIAVLVAAVVFVGVTVAGHQVDSAPLQVVGAVGTAAAGLWLLGTISTPDTVGDTLARMSAIAVIGAGAFALDRIGGSEATLARNGFAAYVYVALFVVGIIDLGSYSPILTTVVWSSAAVALIVAGAVFERTTIMRLGIGTVAAILVKVFLIDLASVETIWKVVMFLGLGVVLLAVGYWISGEDA